ncbi:MAG: arginyltransferase [Waddliaceae bacterium]|nr:arginyltransferase [Waddliaceae bacterium]
MQVIPLPRRNHSCSYLDNLRACFEEYLIQEITNEERAILIERGYRSFGSYFFRPLCNGCHRCVPIRVPVLKFEMSKSQKKLIRKGKEIRVEVAKPVYSEEKWDIYLDHSRRFPQKEDLPNKDNFIFSFYNPRVSALEFSYYLDDHLIAVGITHEGTDFLSSVYFTYRLDYASYSLGSFSTLQEIFYCKNNDLRYLYLGYYIRDNHFMSYKSKFRPNQVLLSEQKWVDFQDAKGNLLVADDPRFSPQATFLTNLFKGPDEGTTNSDKAHE